MISFTNVTKQYGAQILFVDASFQINAGEKVGLVGPNGSGKTTIFRLITGEESPDDGNVERPRKLTHRLLPPGRRRPARAAPSSPRPSPAPARWPTLGEELNALEHKMATPATISTKAVERFGEVQARYQELGGYELEARAHTILAGLGLRSRAGRRRRRHALGRLEDARRARADPPAARPTRCSSTSRPTTSTSSRSSGSRASCATTRARSS